MKFVVTRTSVFPGEDPKVSGTKKEKLISYLWDEPDKEEECWTMELNTIDDLFKLMEAEGQNELVIKHKSYSEFRIPEVEVYDTWRE